MEIRELKGLIETKKAEVRGFIDTKDAEKAKEANEELRALKDNLAIAEELEAEEMRELQAQKTEKEERGAKEKMEKRTQEQQDAFELRAIIKAVAGKKLNEEERAYIANDGTNGESYILPQTISTKINSLIRQYKSFRDVVGYMPSTTLTGSFPIEDFETVSGLIDFTEDGTTDLEEAKDIKFKNVSYALKEKGAFIALTNTLLQMTDNDLINYVAKIFAKKAMITENTMAVTTLNNGKTVKQIADWKALKKSLNTDLDPAVLYGCVLVTNQDGFDFLDSAVDAQGRPILNTNVADATQKTFAGYPIVVFSNSLLPTTGTTTKKAPIFYGNLDEAVKFVDNGKYSFATSSEAGFLKNVTYARVIEYIDCIQVDSSDKLYIAGQLNISNSTTTAA